MLVCVLRAVYAVVVLNIRNFIVIMAAQAGAPLHFELYTEDDDVNYIRWKWISRKEAHRVLCGIDATLLKRSGLHDALWMDWARPEEGLRMSILLLLIYKFDDRAQSNTVGGREVPLTIDTVREYFLLPEGNLVLRTARHYDDLSDWVPERSRTAKTWYANDVFLPVWRPIIQLVNVVLLGKLKPLEVTGAFLYILKNKVGPADEDEDLDWATYFKEKLRKEIRTCKKHGSPSSPNREDTASSDNEPLVGFGSPIVLYPPDDDKTEEAVAVLISLAASDPSSTSKGKRPVEHRSSSESEEIRFVRPDRMKRRVADPVDEVGGPVSNKQRSRDSLSW
ncbi:hypothetical protein R1sor_024818 [Riccia sorocarpa]|uniref:Uncharacterized protein n=1 Tax=Riccia sorocarpa TaxID=122646 RepID=A0ABD3GUK8_9MARC